MIDPFDITKYDLNNSELEEYLIFWVFAAGKKATTAARSLDDFLLFWRKKTGKTNPFAVVKHVGNKLPSELKRFGVGCFNNKAITLKQLADSGLDLKKCTLTDLEKIKGIGKKTSRCFLIHSRRNQRCAGIDTHVLKYLKSLGYEVPKSTPAGKKYDQIESIFLKLVDESGLTLPEFDLKIWTKYAKGNK